MNKNIVKTLFISIVLLFSIVFINIDGVKGMGTPDGNGYAECWYGWDEEEKGFKVVNKTKHFLMAITVFRDTNGNYNGYAVTGCTEGSLQTMDDIKSNQCNLKNYDSIFNEVMSKTLGVSFRGDLTNKGSGKWQCPAIYTKSSYNSDDVELSLKYKSDFTKRTATEKHNSNTDSPTLNDETIDDINPYSKINGEDYSKNSKYDDASTDQIKCWANPESCGKKVTRECEYYDGKYYGSKGKIVSAKTYAKQCKTTEKCDLIPETIIEFMNNLFFIIQIIGIILLIIMTAVEFIKVITGSEENGLRDALKHTYQRIIVVIILLILPMIIIWLLNVINDNRYQKENGNYLIGDDGNPLCK